jgi:sugar/nucleoside kinase (ribokinase family)
MPRDFQLCGLGNAIVDIFLEVSDADFAPLGYDRGTMRLVDHDEQHRLLTKFAAGQPRLVSGGSVANSVIGFSQLGGRAAYIGCIGDDRYGLHYQEEFRQLGIDFVNPPLVGETSGTSVIMVTPDAERTMRTNLAVAALLADRHVPAATIAASDWLYVEGYPLANPGTGQSAVRTALDAARQAGTKVALTCSDAFIPEVFGDAFFAALKQSDLLFANATEAQAVTKTGTVADAFAKLKDLVPNCVVTDGPHGSHVRYAGAECHVPAFPCQPKDLTGAGDMFAGGFLYGVITGLDPEAAARGANFLAMKVISQVGARLHHGVREFWVEAVSA